MGRKEERWSPLCALPRSADERVRLVRDSASRTNDQLNLITRLLPFSPQPGIGDLSKHTLATQLRGAEVRNEQRRK